MKIIGQGPTKGIDKTFFIEATENEVANLIGFYWQGAEGMPKLKIGDEIFVSQMYQQLKGLAGAKNKLHDVAGALRAVADLVEIKIPVIEAARATEEGNA